MRPLIALTSLIFIVVVVPLGLYLWATGAFNTSKDVRVENPTVSVRDARQLIADFRDRGDPSERVKYFRPEELPESLQIPHLRSAYVLRDHVNLEMGRNPDYSIGARIWSADTKIKHLDKPTAYPEIFFYIYCNDNPTTPSNQF